MCYNHCGYYLGNTSHKLADCNASCAGAGPQGLTLFKLGTLVEHTEAFGVCT
jgi:hypothetical protein